jgi:hypothetical protein
MEQTNTTELTSKHKPRNMFIDIMLLKAYEHSLLDWSGNYVLFRPIVCHCFHNSQKTSFVHILAKKAQFCSTVTLGNAV